MLFSPLRVCLPLNPVLEIARRACLGLYRVQAARAKYLHAVPMAGLSRRDGLARLAWLVPQAKAIRVPHLHRALPLLPAVDGRRACLFHAQLVMAIRLTRAPVWPPVPRDQLCPAEQAYLRGHAPHRLDLCHRPVPGYQPHAPQHESAGEYSSDFQL